MIPFEQILGVFRRIFCECPDCGNVFRLSESEITSDLNPPKDWLSKIDDQIRDLEKKIERSEELFKKKRDILVEKERKKIESSTYRKINKLVPSFSTSRFNTRDLKTIGYPIKFISFDGKDAGWVKKVRLIDFYPESTQQEKVLDSLSDSVKKGNIEWKTLRITHEGKIEEEK